MKTCTCPIATTIQEISTDACPYDIGQVQKIIIQRKFSTGVTRNTIADAATAILLATWTVLLAAADGTLAQITPYIANPSFVPGAAKEYGSDNQVPNGIPRVVGSEHTPFTSEILSLSPTIATELKELACEDLQIYLVNENSQIIGIENTDDTIQGIDAQQMFVSDRQIGGFAEPDKVMISFKLKPNWSDGLIILTPTAFDPLTALIN